MNKEKPLLPKLFLAPMEGVGALPFRKAIASIGGFDECCTEFIRIPSNAHIPSLIKDYDPLALFPIPQAAQIMGSDPSLMGEAAFMLGEKGAPRIELNCGCPSNIVTGRGAGSSLLKTPSLLYNITKSMCNSTPAPVSVKMRAGYDDTSLFKENLLAAQEAGASFISLHARTKADGYHNPATWEWILEAKKTLKIPVIGNGDIKTPADAEAMLIKTGCDALMIGRAAVSNPWIFWEIKSHFTNIPFTKTKKQLELFLDEFINHIFQNSPMKNKINHFKQLSSFLLKHNQSSQNELKPFLTTRWENLETMKERLLAILSNSLDLFI